MKVIDLLNKIANGEELPNYVQYYNILRDKIDIMMVCKENIYYKLDNLEIQINSRVKPVEEPKGIPEKLESYISCGWYGTCKDLKREELFKDLKKIGSKINEIIDYLKSKGE